jgi:hypothetical protein
VGANPRRAAGSTVVFSWLRLFRCTEDKKHHEDLKNLLPTFDIGSHSNATLQAPLEAGATAGADAVSGRLQALVRPGMSNKAQETWNIHV